MVPKSRLDKLIPQVKEWAEGISRPEGFVIGSVNDVDNYIAGKSFVRAASMDLFSLGMKQIGLSLLAAYQGQWLQANQYMAFGFARTLVSEMIGIGQLKGSDQTIVDNLDGATQVMLGTIAMGQPHLVKPFHRAVFAGINDGYGIRDGRDPPLGTTLRYAAFGLSIIGEWLGEPLDLDKHALPRDPAWGLLVAHWREPDPDKLLPVLLAICDTHVERIAVTDREVDRHSEKFEFGSVFEAVHPTEILAVLRLREMLGLVNPANIEHPLMKTPYARITCMPGAIIERDELLDRFVATVRERDPHVLPPGF